MAWRVIAQLEDGGLVAHPPHRARDSPSSSVVSTTLPGSATGIADSNFRVYACCGDSKICRREPISTIWPSSSTATRWLTCSTTAMSWVMKR